MTLGRRTLNWLAGIAMDDAWWTGWSTTRNSRRRRMVQVGGTAEVIAGLLDLPAPGTRHTPALACTAPTGLWLPPG